MELGLEEVDLVPSIFETSTEDVREPSADSQAVDVEGEF